MIEMREEGVGGGGGGGVGVKANLRFRHAHHETKDWLPSIVFRGWREISRWNW